MKPYRSNYSRAEDYGTRNARLAGDGWSGHAAKRSPRRQPATETLRELGALARRFRELTAKPEERKP